MLLDRDSFGDHANAGNVMNRDEAETLINNWVINDKLKLHMRQVAHLMKQWALLKEELNGEEKWKWELAGLLHDADYDQWPGLHCKKIIEELELRRIDPEIIRAIASHGPAYFGVKPRSKMDKMLYAFDELSGLIHAYSLVRSTGYAGMDVKGVKKRLKEKAFAASVSRTDIADATERAGILLDDLITFIISHQGNVTP